MSNTSASVIGRKWA